jgi:hypothetical protein
MWLLGFSSQANPTFGQPADLIRPWRIESMLRLKSSMESANKKWDAVPVVPREYAGKWLAWSADGRRIVTVGESFEAVEQAAVEAGFPADQVAIERVPTSRQRLTGSGK